MPPIGILFRHATAAAHLGAAALFALPMSHASANPAAPMSPRQTAERATVIVPKEYEYLRYLPPDYDTAPERRWPLLLFLHGAGERGADIAKLRTHGLPKQIEEGRDLPFVVISPQCPAGEWWNVVALEALIDKLVAEQRIDPDRIYLTGLSMGAFATWALAIMRPERYAAILPICGGGDPHRARVLRDVPVWTFHGDADQTVTITQSQQMVDAIKSVGGSPRFTIYPGVGHDAWTATYDNPEVYAWLLSHRLSERQPAK